MAILRKRKWYWILSSVLFVFSIFFTGLGWLIIKFHHSYLSIPSNHLIGYRPTHVSGLNEKGFPFSFLVIGDTRASRIAEVLIEMAYERGSVSFKSLGVRSILWKGRPLKGMG